MEVKTNKNGLWILKDNVETLIWENDYTDDMELIDLTPVTINTALIEELRQSITDSDYSQIIYEINNGEIREQIYQEVIDEKYDEFVEIVENDPWIPADRRDIEVQNLIEEEVDTRVDAYARGVIEDKTQAQVKQIEKDNTHKLALKAKATPLAIEPEMVAINEEDDNLIKSITYLPDFLQEKPVFKDASKLLDILISNYDDDTIKEIYEAYCDTLYKWPRYNKLSYGARLTLLQENGFQYMLDLLLHMYDAQYNKLCRQYDAGEITEIQPYDEFVKEKTDDALSKITMLFELLYTLKGKTLGLELALELVNMPSFVYIPWDIIANVKGNVSSIDDLPLPGGDIEVKKGDVYSLDGNATNYYIFNGVAWHPITALDEYLTPREPFTAILDIYGLEDAEAEESTSKPQVTADLQTRLAKFVRSYMLPYIDVTLRFDAEVDAAICYPSGAAKLIDGLNCYDYDDQGTHKKHDLTHIISDEHWHTAGTFEPQVIQLGIPFEDEAFKGSFTLINSYVQDPDGTKHYLYGTVPHLANIVGGTAAERVQESGEIVYEDDYLTAPLEQYIDVDIVTGDQQNPYYLNDEFIRDTVIKFFSQLTVGAIHLNKTIEEMEQILIGDFEREYTECEVWLGRSTSLDCQSGWNYKSDINDLIDENVNKYTAGLLEEYPTLNYLTIAEYVDLYKEYIDEDTTYYKKGVLETQLVTDYENLYPDIIKLKEIPMFYEFETTPRETKEIEGIETTHLIFCEEQLDANYTGIGDLGILGANDYFIYNGMLLYHSDKLRQVGSSKKWTDIGASHAVSEMYYTPGICDGDLKMIHLGELYDIVRDPNTLDAYETHLIEHKRITNERLESETLEQLEKEIIRSFEEDWYTIDEEYWDEQESSQWQIITGYVNEYYTAFGICNGRLYKIYQNPLYGGEDQPFLVYQIMDNEQGWTYITGAAYSETYEAYGIKNQRLYRISADGYLEITKPDTREITDITKVIYNDNTITYTTFEGQDTIELTVQEIIYDEDTEDPEDDWSEWEITQIKFNGVEQEFERNDNYYTTENLGITYDYDGQLLEVVADTEEYRAHIEFDLGDVTNYRIYEKEALIGWDSTFDCISRYHHSNDIYTTYGICAGVLYSINDKTLTKLNDTLNWTHICGYYNDGSPRTYAYAIADGKLYELIGNTFTLKDDTNIWTDIHGCTTATNNYVLGLTSAGYIYKINKTTLTKIDNNNDWIKIFGRVTNSQSASANCYGYGVRNIDGKKKLYEITKDGISIISGFWKADGLNEIVDLEDYNIHEVKTNLPDGTTLNSIQEIKETAINDGTVLSDYDIYVTYNTKGFDNNTRYNIRTELHDTNYLYQHPSECRVNIDETYSYDLFDVYTGLISGFTKRNVTIHGADVITGDGTAYRLKETNTYLEIPNVYNLQETVIKFSCTIDDDLNPIILDKDSKSGLYYGKYNSQYGIFVKYEGDGTTTFTRVVELNPGDNVEYTTRFVGNETCDIYIIGIGKVFSSNSASNKYVYVPKYIGGDGTEFGDATIYLQDSYLQGEILTKLFENEGLHFTIETIEQDLVETLITDNSQDMQKVIEVVKADNEVLELSMDELYSTLDLETSNPDLTVETDYVINRFQHDPYEGITEATLTFSGAYELDPEKITSNVPLGTVCDFENTGIADHLNEWSVVHFKLDPSVTTPIKIKSGSNVDNQVLYKTEENEAYTNKYLLTNTVEAVSEVELHTDPSGVIYEIDTEVPGVKTRSLTYNNTSFELDETKIDDYELYYFDSYLATLTFYPYYEWVPERAEEVYFERYARIQLVADEVVEDQVVTCNPKIKINSKTVNEKCFMFGDNEFKTLGIGDYYYDFDITKTYIGYNDTYLTELNPEPDPKDQLHYDKGKCWNFNETSYFELNNFAQGMVLCLETDDDTSKDQGIFQFGNNSFCIKDNVWTLVKDGIITKSVETAWDKTRTFIKFKENKISISKDEITWIDLFEDVTVSGNMQIGYAEAGSGYLPFNGTIDLARSYIFNNGKRRLYKMNQITNVKISQDGITFTDLITLNDDYTVDEIWMGYEFTGNVDCYYSKLLKSYDLQWVADRMDLDTYVKNILQQRDPNYHPELDPNTYNITAWGVHVTGEPQRWNTVTATYNTIDNAYYMKPNTEYQIKMDVIDDKESGKISVEIVDNPTLESGILSDFINGYAQTLLTGQYIVLKLSLTDIQDQVICGYPDTISQSIFIEDGKVKYFDDINKHELFDARIGDLYLKLYSTENNIEYSLDGENWIDTEVSAQFSAYDTFNLGVGYVDGNADYFHGEIDLTESFIQTTTPEYLFVYYKKIIPQIYDGTWHNLALEPLLTVRDYVEFALGFDGTIYMFNSGLCLPDTKYWTANQITIKDGDIILDKVIRDEVSVLPEYTIVNNTVRVNPEDLYVYVTGSPRIGDKLTLTYNSWYLFRETNAKYEFKVTNTDTTSYISFKKKDDKDGKYPEYIIYITNKQNLIVKTGYQFGGYLSCPESTRDGMMLCDYQVFYTYLTKYKRSTDTEWKEWNQFITERRMTIYEGIGYKLKGTHYLATSWIKTDLILTPFVTYYNYEYIEPVGQVSFSLDGQGTVTGFSEDNYLEMIMSKIQAGSKIRLWLTTGDNISDQGVSTFVQTKDGYFQSTVEFDIPMDLTVGEVEQMNISTIENTEVRYFDGYTESGTETIKMNKLRKNYRYVMEYDFSGGDITVGDVDGMLISELETILIKQFATGENGVKVRILGYNVEGEYQPRQDLTHTVTLVPYNPNIKEGEYGYYVTTPEQAEDIKVYYRKIELDDDPEQAEWIETTFESKTIPYFGSRLTVYCSQIEFPNTEFEYYMGEKVQFKIKSDTITYLQAVPFNSMLIKQKAIF